MEEATEKQIKFALSLGIEKPEQFSKLALKEIIDKKLNPNKPVEVKTQPQPSNEQSNAFTEKSWVYNVSVKPNSFEWGKPSHRHKVYYDEPEELKVHIKALKEAGLYEDDIFETQKI